MALQISSQATVHANDSRNSDEIECQRKVLLQHFVNLFKKACNYSGGFDIHATNGDIKPHIGLGSTSSLVIATLIGCNKSIGEPLSYEDIRLLLGNSYVEEASTKEDSTQLDVLAPGYETGMTGFAAEKGGMIVIADRLVPVCRYPVQNSKGQDFKAFIVAPVRGSGDSKEVDAENNLVNEYETLEQGNIDDNKNNAAFVKAHLILMDLIPALHYKEFDFVASAIWKTQSMGSKKTEIDKHGKQIFPFMNEIRKKQSPSTIVAMSSIGPSIVVVVDPDSPLNNAKELEEIASKFGMKVFVETCVDNKGYLVEEVN